MKKPSKKKASKEDSVELSECNDDWNDNPAYARKRSKTCDDMKLSPEEASAKGLDVYGSKKGCLCTREGYFKYFSGAWIYYRLLDNIGQDSPNDLYEKLQNEWTTIGVICALLLSLTYGPFIQPNHEDFKDATELQEMLFTVLGAFSLGMPATAVQISTFYYILLNMLQVEDTPRFVEEFAHVLFLPALTFIISVTVVLLNVIASCYFIYPESYLAITILCAIACVVFITIMIFMMCAVFRDGGIMKSSPRRRKSSFNVADKAS